MITPTSDLFELLRTLEPELKDGVYVFSSLPHDAELNQLEAIATVREQEGITVVIREEMAMKCGLPILYRATWITLSVHSDLQAVGLTAAFAHALARAKIGCNVMAGAFHDHIFVPVESARDAMSVLRNLQQEACDNPANPGPS